MSPEKKILWTVGVLASVILLAFALWPGAKERLAPRPVAAHVALLSAGAEAAVTGPIEIAAGTGFTLYAVLEARGRGGDTVYYTEAPALEMAGERVPAESLLRWDRDRVAKVFWFTVEGFTPYVKLEEAAQLDRFHFTEFFRPEWPAAWTVQGRLDPKFSDALARESVVADDRSFGSQRFQVRIELFPDDKTLTAQERFLSPGAEALPDAVEGFPTVYAALPGPAGPASLAFGLSQIEPPPSPDPELAARLAALGRQRLAFSRVPLIGQVIREAGRSRGDLDWTTADLTAGPPWSDADEAGGAVGTGDLVRAGARVVVLFRDRGVEGRLDREDLCFDYERGAAVRPLSEVFSGEGLVEIARL